LGGIRVYNVSPPLGAQNYPEYYTEPKAYLFIMARNEINGMDSIAANFGGDLKEKIMIGYLLKNPVVISFEGADQPECRRRIGYKTGAGMASRW
jgi:hypothetical protein